MPATMSNTTYSPQEIADRLGRHVNSIRRNLREGELKGEKFSNEWIVTEEALQEWLPAPIYREHFGSPEEA
jgi:excisionase family DNA binding protein